jgi:hypothetical protein
MGREHSVSAMRVRYRASTAVAVAMASIFGLAGLAQAAEVLHRQDEHLKPNGKGWGELDPSGSTERNASKFATTSNNGILYHGGPLMLGTTNLYYIWYGNWTGDPGAQTLLQTFGGSIGGSPYFNINTTYYDGSGTHVGGTVKYLSSISDNYSQGTALSDNAVQQIVASALSRGSLPTDPNGVYFVLTSQDVNETSGFCTQYCAWHNHATINGQDVKYGFVGNPARCPSACAAQTTTPNGDLAGDSMANLVAHELEESVTDPDLNAWFDRRGRENADKCAWTFGTTQTASNGAKYNMTLGSKNWLVQQNWVNASGGYCAIKYP